MFFAAQNLSFLNIGKVSKVRNLYNKTFSDIYNSLSYCTVCVTCFSGETRNLKSLGINAEYHLVM